MDVFVCDHSFSQIQIIDNYTTFIWTERYKACGDFELDIPYDEALYHVLVHEDGLSKNFYLQIPDSETIMIIEDVHIVTNIETGNVLKVTGRSYESILDRRIIYGQMSLTGNLQNGIKSIMTKNFISPTDTKRQISNLSFRESTDPEVTGKTIDAQYYCDNVYDVIVEQCEVNGLGFRIAQQSPGQLYFELYSGTNRAYSQTTVPYIIFAPGFNNLIDSDYYESSKNLKSVAVIAGEGDTSARKIIEQEASDDAPTGLYRRELYVDAGSISQKVTENGSTRTLSNAEYNAELQNKGKEELANYPYEKSFEAEVESSVNFIYGQDYFLGDIVEIENEYGIRAVARVAEFVRSVDIDGYREYPTFESVLDEE